MFALLFAVAGLVVFVLSYYKLSGGNLFVALSNPLFVLVVLVPFVPSIVLSWLAHRLEKKMIAKFNEESASSGKPTHR